MLSGSASSGDIDVLMTHPSFFSYNDDFDKVSEGFITGIQTLRSGLKKRGAAEFFLTNFEVFGYQMKHSFECLI